MTQNTNKSKSQRPLYRRIVQVVGVIIGILVLLAVILVIYVQIAWDRPVNRASPQITVPRDGQTVARGEYLYKYSNLCWTCHGSEGSTSAEEPQAGGRKFDLSGFGPGFGVFYASNITQSPDKGIGEWSDGEILRSIREGLDREGHILLPIMPFQFYHGMSDQDAEAMVAYLRSLPAVENQVPENQPTFAAKAVIAFRLMKPEAPITKSVVAPEKGVTVEYGEYLAWHAAGCADCHMPRDPNTGQIDFERTFAGGLTPLPEEGFSPIGSNLTPHAETGLGNWTEEQFLTAMQQGTRPDGRVLVPFMPWPSYARWDVEDVRAIWLYLRSLEPIDHAVPATELTGAAVGSGLERGQALYKIYCMACHGKKGSEGAVATMPLIDLAPQMDDASLSKIIMNGFPPVMPGFGNTFTTEQVNDLINAIQAWKE